MTFDTIFAIATAPGRAGIAIFRVSGPEAGLALRAIHSDDLPPPRRAVRSRLRDPATGETIDEALCLWFPSPSSMTGEDLAEFHVHGGHAVSAGLAAALQQIEGIGPAEPGEFTRRAFENGKLDLTEAEAIADLVDAEMCMPGDNVKLNVVLHKQIAMDNGVRFAIREGGRTVGSGVVTKSVE